MKKAKTVPIRINILAYNEANFIQSCLHSVQAALREAQHISAEVNVICNGCTDNTFMLASELCSKYTDWQVIDIEFGDKANAWNTAIEHGIAKGNKLTIFLDGDCLMGTKTIQGFIDAYQQNKFSYILAGIPKTKGRTTRNIISRTLKGEALSGNLYALTPNFLNEITHRGFRLPIGLIGDDSLLAWVASHNFMLSNGFSYGFLIGCADAQFTYHRLAPNSFNNIYLYIRRLMRYSLRHLQQHAIREYLNEFDLFELLPTNVNALYDKITVKHLRISWIYSIFDMITYVKIRKIA